MNATVRRMNGTGGCVNRRRDRALLSFEGELITPTQPHPQE
jgi:hypothetical protein